MVNWIATALCALAGAATATVAPGFPIQAAPDLNATWGGNDVSPPGELIPRADTASPPTQISTPVWTTEGRAILMLVDIDVPRNGTRVPLLHWLTSNVTMPSTDTQILKLPDAALAEASYLQPSPPVNDTPHKYTLLLFEQPENFTIPARFRSLLQTRVGWDTAAFVNATGLGGALAANWIRVQNVTGETSASPSATPSPSSNVSVPSATPSTYPGAGAAVQPSAWAAGLGSALVAGLMAVAL
ncbi:hypothetical protein N0V90_002858 [Kalmusia sp. IMI 367209]|nr:hypothetical protein N0V90_002858 [Kalmusia sp. IMI 367209]